MVVALWLAAVCALFAVCSQQQRNTILQIPQYIQPELTAAIRRQVRYMHRHHACVGSMIVVASLIAYQRCSTTADATSPSTYGNSMIIVAGAAFPRRAPLTPSTRYKPYQIIGRHLSLSL